MDINPSEIRRRLNLSDEELLKECDTQAYQASGPGGQKRNRTYSAVRLVHPPSGLSVTASESRSQHGNRLTAVRRLKEEIALEFRQPLPKKIVWPQHTQVKGRLSVGAKNPAVPEVIAILLDAIYEHEGKLGEASSALDLTSSNMVKFLSQHLKAWARTNRIRKEFGLAPLKK